MASTDDLWLLDFGDPFPGEPASYRPALILGPPASFGPRFPFVVVAPLTTTDRGLSLHVEVESSSDTGLDTTSWVQCELIRSVNRGRLLHYLGRVDHVVRQQVATILSTLLRHH